GGGADPLPDALVHLPGHLRGHPRAGRFSDPCPLREHEVRESVMTRQHNGARRGGAAAVEFAIVAGLLFTIFLGMIEVGRALMALAAVSNAARAGARAGAVP